MYTFTNNIQEHDTSIIQINPIGKQSQGWPCRSFVVSLDCTIFNMEAFDLIKIINNLLHGITQTLKAALGISHNMYKL